MFELQYCNFTGLPGSEDLKLDFSKIMTLTGPNGTGKSTVLRVLDLAFRILEEREVCAKLPAHDPWHVFKTVELKFECKTPLRAGLLGDIQSISIFIECDGSSYCISEISSNERSLLVAKPVLKSELESWEEMVKQAKQQMARFEQEIHSAPPPSRDQMLKQQIVARNKASEQEAENTKKIEKNKMISIEFREGDNEKNSDILRSDFNDLLKALNIPSVRLITTEQLMKQDIPALINHLMVLKKGNKSASRRFRDSEERLNELLQSEIDVSETQDGQALHINGIPYKNASTGTYLTLSFFALTESEDRNKIVLWDEPENGLHPTRRIQLLELMRLDGRQFIIATHATEFAPVLQNDCKVYRCIIDYKEEISSLQFSVVAVATRRDAFVTLEALGIHPARTLFTANVVIWVEGPTELLFYRHWLSRRLEKDGYQEGLHYSFMQYGGSLINYLEVADEPQLESTIDLLSHCRHPIVLVDSDIKEPAILGIESYLKPGAKRLLSEIMLLNSERSGAAIFQATRGREIENYLPAFAILHAIESIWGEFSNIKKDLDLDNIDLGDYKKYPEALDDFFKREKILDADGLARGRSIWGSANKVAMMNAALSTPNFDEQKLKLNCSEDLDEIDKFIRSKHDVSYPNGLRN